MSTSHDSPRELQHTYIVQDRSNSEELARLQLQDKLVTAAMGGALPEQPDPSIFRRLLDVGCGPGGWLIEAAKSYANLSLLVGIDANSKMVAYAREQAQIAGVSDRVEFHVMDALQMLEFPHNYFDLVNHRSAASWLRTWDWPRLLHEYLRVCRAGGIIRVTEANFIKESSSPALNQLTDLALQALHNAGHYFTPQGDGVTSHIAGLLQRSGIKDVQTRVYTMICYANTPDWQGFFDDARYLFRTMQPFLSRWTRAPGDYEVLYQQMLIELQQPDFTGTVEAVTAWGSK
jgi:ubiquinone/menaquinone biosynthesis C-methylase UbiE